MSSNLNKPKVPVALKIACLVILLLTAGYIKNHVLINNIDKNTEQTSASPNLKELFYKNGAYSFSKIVSTKKTKIQVLVKPKPIIIIILKQIGYISKVYDKDGKRYLSFDDVKFLTGDAAIEAAKNDGTAIYEDGKYYVPDDYYIINTNKNIKNYVISSSASLNVLDFLINPIKNDISNHSTTYTTFKSIANKMNGHMLCYIYTQNNIIVKVEGQYTP